MAGRRERERARLTRVRCVETWNGWQLLMLGNEAGAPERLSAQRVTGTQPTFTSPVCLPLSQHTVCALL